MARVFCLLLFLQSLWLSAFSATIEWPENTSQGSGFPKLTLSNWIENNGTYLPNDAGNRPYFIGYVPARGPTDDSQAHIRPFSIQAFRDNPKLKELSLSFKLWFHDDSVVVDSKFQPIVTEKAKFSPKTLTGTAEYFKDYVFRSFLDISYAFQDLRARYFEERLYDNKLPANLAVLNEISLNYQGRNGSKNMRCFQLLPLRFSDDEGKKALSETKLKLFISLGHLGSEGLIYLTDWTISDRQNVCPYDYFMLNVDNSRLVVAGERDQLDQLRKVTQPMQGLIFNDATTSAPQPDNPFGRIQPGRWYYYNRKYDTLYQRDPRDVIPEVSICDIAGNCFHYTDPIDGKYVLDEQTKKFLGNTPFVRYNFDETKGQLDGDLSNHFGEQRKWFDEMKSQFTGSVKAVGTLTKDVQKTITIPMKMLDVRFMSAKYVLACTKPVKILSADIGRNKMDLSILPETNKFFFSTQDYFYADPTDVRDIEDVVLTLTTSYDSVACTADEQDTEFKFSETVAQDSVKHDGSSFIVRDHIVRYSTDWVKYADNITFRYNEIKAEFTIISEKHITEAMKQKVRVTRMIFGKDYYESYTGDYQNKWGPTINFDKDGNKLEIKEDVQTLPQTTIGSAVRIEYIVQLPGYIPDTPREFLVEMNSEDSDIGMEIDSFVSEEQERKRAENEAKMKAEEDEIKRKAIKEAAWRTDEDEEAKKKAEEEAKRKAEETKKRAEEIKRNAYKYNANIQMKAYKEGEGKCIDNSFAHQNCQYETSKCPSSFNSEKHACTMVTQYIAHVEECEPTSCSNLLAKPVHKMNIITAATPEGRRFYPLSSLAQNNQTYLRVSFEPRPYYDSCVLFRYYGSKNKLLLDFDGTDSQLTLNYETDPDGYLEVTACSSQYTRHPDKVNGFTFRFTGSESQFESNIGDHFVEFVKFDFNKRLENNDNFV